MEPFGALRFRNVCPVAVFACLWSRLVEEHFGSIHRLLECVTCCARDVLVSALQRESRLLMIKKRGLPLVTGMARFTLASPSAKLIRVWIIVAFAAFYGGFSEIHVTHVEFQVRRFVTIGAGHRAMRSDQRERRMRMIELRQILPFFCGVARLAP